VGGGCGGRGGGCSPGRPGMRGGGRAGVGPRVSPIVMLPTPARARNSQAKEPTPPRPTTRTEASRSLSMPSSPTSSCVLCCHGAGSPVAAPLTVAFRRCDVGCSRGNIARRGRRRVGCPRLSRPGPSARASWARTATVNIVIDIIRDSRTLTISKISRSRLSVVPAQRETGGAVGKRASRPRVHNIGAQAPGANRREY